MGEGGWKYHSLSSKLVKHIRNSQKLIQYSLIQMGSSPQSHRTHHKSSCSINKNGTIIGKLLRQISEKDAERFNALAALLQEKMTWRCILITAKSCLIFSWKRGLVCITMPTFLQNAKTKEKGRHHFSDRWLWLAEGHGFCEFPGLVVFGLLYNCIQHRAMSQCRS